MAKSRSNYRFVLQYDAYDVMQSRIVLMKEIPTNSELKSIAQEENNVIPIVRLLYEKVECLGGFLICFLFLFDLISEFMIVHTKTNRRLQDFVDQRKI